MMMNSGVITLRLQIKQEFISKHYEHYPRKKIHPLQVKRKSTRDVHPVILAQ
jgi:hypothetical protein